MRSMQASGWIDLGKGLGWWKEEWGIGLLGEGEAWETDWCLSSSSSKPACIL